MACKSRDSDASTLDLSFADVNLSQSQLLQLDAQNNAPPAGYDQLIQTALAQRSDLQANSSLQLAQTRYQLGLSSIVELSQAQLQQTSAARSESVRRLRLLCPEIRLRM